MPNNKIHLISKDNLDEYVELPGYIMEKWEKGEITHAHFSDILRTELLIRYGGLWLDATVFLTDSVPEWVFGQKLLMYQYSNPHDVTMVCNSWFIYSCPRHPVLLAIRDGLYEYWKNETRVKEYFLWHQFATLAFDNFPQALEDMRFVSNTIPNVLAKYLNREFEEANWEHIKQLSSVHKLSHKIAIPEEIWGTYWEKILYETTTKKE